MSEADNPTTPRKRSSHRPAGFGPLPDRDKKELARQPALSPEVADDSQLLAEPLPDGSFPEATAGAEARLNVVADAGAESTALEPMVTEPAAPEPFVANDWVSRLASEFDADTATDDFEGQLHHLQEQNLRLQEQNRDLLEQKAILEITLEETQTALQLQMTRSQNQETLLVQQAQALAESQTQTSSLYRDLELVQQTAQRQQIMIETLTEQLESSQERIVQLEREVITAQERVNEKVHALMQAEMACQDLKTRLSRQQRYATQFKTALERCLDMPALRRSMFHATSTSAGSQSITDVTGEEVTGEPEVSESSLGDRGDTLPTIGNQRPNPEMSAADLDLVEVSSHLHSLLNEAAASSNLDLSASSPLDSSPLDSEEGDTEGDGTDGDADALDTRAASTREASLLEPPFAPNLDRIESLNPVAREDALPAAVALTEASADESAAILTEVAAEVATEAEVSSPPPESLRSDASAPAAPDPTPFPANRMQAELWRRFNQWAASSEAETTAAAIAADTQPADASKPEAEQPAGPIPAGIASRIAPAAPPPRGIQPLRPSPHVPRFVSQWSEAVGRTAPASQPVTSQPAVASQPVASQPAAIAAPSIAPPVTPPSAAPAATSFTMTRRPAEASPSPTPAVSPVQGELAVQSRGARGSSRKRIELPPPQAETAAAAATSQAAATEANEADFQAMANWPSPLVYPLRSPKKRQSLAAIDLPNFARPHS